MSHSDENISAPSLKSEIWFFLFVTFFLIPGITVALVGVYGFSLWFYQIFSGNLPTGG